MVPKFYTKNLKSFQAKMKAFKIQHLDIATLLGAKGPQQGLKGPQPSTGARRKGV